MKIVYEAEDGVKFETQVECESHEKTLVGIMKSRALLEHIREKCPETYCDDSGFDYSTEDDIGNYIVEYFDEISELIARIKK